MLTISFYGVDGQLQSDVEVAEDLYAWLIKSDFSKIGKSRKTKIHVDGEAEKLQLVNLGRSTRRKLTFFFRNEIISESDTLMIQLGDSPSKREYQDATYRLRKLQELRKCIENERYQYLERV